MRKDRERVPSEAWKHRNKAVSIPRFELYGGRVAPDHAKDPKARTMVILMDSCREALPTL